MGDGALRESRNSVQNEVHSWPKFMSPCVVAGGVAWGLGTGGVVGVGGWKLEAGGWGLGAAGSGCLSYRVRVHFYFERIREREATRETI